MPSSVLHGPLLCAPQPPCSRRRRLTTRRAAWRATRRWPPSSTLWTSTAPDSSTRRHAEHTACLLTYCRHAGTQSTYAHHTITHMHTRHLCASRPAGGEGVLRGDEQGGAAGRRRRRPSSARRALNEARGEAVNTGSVGGGWRVWVRWQGGWTVTSVTFRRGHMAPNMN